MQRQADEQQVPTNWARVPYLAPYDGNPKEVEHVLVKRG
jgi:hypothetical protein